MNKNVINSLFNYKNCVLYILYLYKYKYIFIKYKYKERWLSGLKRLIANPLYNVNCTEGSNPSLSDKKVKQNKSFLRNRKFRGGGKI